MNSQFKSKQITLVIYRNYLLVLVPEIQLWDRQFYKWSPILANAYQGYWTEDNDGPVRTYSQKNL